MALDLRTRFGYRSENTFRAASWTSTSSQTIAGSLPPLVVQVSMHLPGFREHLDGLTHNSRVTRFSVLLQLSITRFPVAVEPVKLILSMPGCPVIHGPKLSSPLRTWKTPGGKKRCASSPNLRPQYGVNGLEEAMLTRRDREHGSW